MINGHDQEAADRRRQISRVVARLGRLAMLLLVIAFVLFLLRIWTGDVRYTATGVLTVIASIVSLMTSAAVQSRLDG